MAPLHRDSPGNRITGGRHDVAPADDGALAFVQRAEMRDGWLHPKASNYTFVVELGDEEQCGFGVYKPQAGEAPLWDFPPGLYKRECAAYELSRALGWLIVPPTVVREGEAGVGSLQLYVPPAEGSNFFTMRETHEAELVRMAVFDLVANNADRKGGHCFAGAAGGVWGVDHGLTFHEGRKLRTVIWDYAGCTVPEALLQDLARAVEMLSDASSEIIRSLGELLASREIDALGSRLRALMDDPVLPSPYSRRDLPWPWL